MDSAVYFILLLLLPLCLFLTRGSSKRLPPGSRGLPLIGHSLGLLKAMRSNKGEQWLQEKVRKYGPIFKLSLFGKPTVFLHGPAANKFVYTCDRNALANHQPASVRRICGGKNIFELGCDDHKRIREALMAFLKPDALKQYVGTMDEEIRMHLKNHWEGKHEIAVRDSHAYSITQFESNWPMNFNQELKWYYQLWYKTNYEPTYTCART